MRPSFSVALAAVYNSLSSNALPQLIQRDGVMPDDIANHPWQPPQPGDRRSPCPGLNTLANHNYLPRSGQGITRNALATAFLQGWGIAGDVIATPTENAFTTCELSRGEGNCPNTFDLDDLNRPHAFEHDHSMSRQDFFRRYFPDGGVDNFTFNRTVFGDTLSVMRGNDIMNVRDAEEVRLYREHLALQRDITNGFIESRLTMLTEIGFVFAVMRNFGASRNNVAIQRPNVLADQQVQVDWWAYWFSREEFPIELGWLKPSPAVKNAYVTGIRSSVFSASVTSTPTPLPSDALKSPTVLPLKPTSPSKRGLDGRAAAASSDFGLIDVANGVLNVPKTIVAEAASIVNKVVPSPAGLAPYDVVYDFSQLKAYESSVSAFESGLSSAIESLASDAGITASPISTPAIATATVN